MANPMLLLQWIRELFQTSVRPSCCCDQIIIIDLLTRITIADYGLTGLLIARLLQPILADDAWNIIAIVSDWTLLIR